MFPENLFTARDFSCGFLGLDFSVAVLLFFHPEEVFCSVTCCCLIPAGPRKGLGGLRTPECSSVAVLPHLATQTGR